MGKVSEKGMERKESNRRSLNRDDETRDERQGTNQNSVEENRLFRCISHTSSTSESGGNTNTPRLAASTSSPSLLTGCANASTHAGANIERHVHVHHVRIVSQSPPLSPIPVSPHPVMSDVTPVQTNPLFSPPAQPTNIDSNIPPDSVFLTPSQPRPLTHERPSSAPSNYLERISGTLLRLVGDHYLCSTCGRQLRTIGDQLTMETNINHIRRAFSATHLERNDD